jgi:outer membrane lipoprotein-sorting protein
MKTMRIGAVVMFLTVSALSEATIESVEKEIQAAWEKVNSFTAHMDLHTRQPLGPMSVDSKGGGEMEFLKVEGKPRYRIEMTITIGSNIPVLKNAESRVLTVFDGEKVYNEVYIEMLDKREVGTVEPDPGDLKSPKSGDGLIESVRSQGGQIRLLPDDAVSGVAAYAFEIIPSEKMLPKSSVQPEKVIVHVAKDSGILLKTAAFDAAGEAFMTVSYSNVKINPELSPDRFVYEIPPGVKVKDLSKMKSGNGPTL